MRTITTARVLTTIAATVAVAITAFGTETAAAAPTGPAPYAFTYSLSYAGQLSSRAATPTSPGYSVDIALSAPSYPAYTVPITITADHDAVVTFALNTNVSSWVAPLPAGTRVNIAGGGGCTHDLAYFGGAQAGLACKILAGTTTLTATITIASATPYVAKGHAEVDFTGTFYPFGPGNGYWGGNLAVAFPAAKTATNPTTTPPHTTTIAPSIPATTGAPVLSPAAPPTATPAALTATPTASASSPSTTALPALPSSTATDAAATTEAPATLAAAAVAQPAGSGISLLLMIGGFLVPLAAAGGYLAWRRHKATTPNRA